MQLKYKIDCYSNIRQKMDKSANTESTPLRKTQDPDYTKNYAKEYYQKNKGKMNNDRKKNLAMTKFNMSPEQADLYEGQAYNIITIIRKCKLMKKEKPHLIEQMLADIQKELL